MGGMAAAIKTFCQDKSLRERLGKNARIAAVEEYNRGKADREAGEIYLELGKLGRSRSIFDGQRLSANQPESAKRWEIK